VTKSFTSALAGIALDQGYLTGVDQKMMDFFPELEDKVTDPRKFDITLKYLLEMLAGYPWEKSTDELFKILYTGFRPSLLADIELVYDPDADMRYSNLSSHLAGVIVARATGRDLLTYADENLFGPLGIEPGEWITDWEGNYNGHADLHLTARDMAKFGQLYLNGGKANGEQLISEDWVRDSLEVHSEHAWDYGIGRSVADMCCGYLWWSAKANGYRYNFAWGHGGQQIALVPDLNIVVVVTADPLFGQHGDQLWEFEKQNLNLVGNFVSTLPLG
jgi:CubicO group peptidase (beta-lactamase class C family)